MRNDVDLGCAAISTARVRLDCTTFSCGAPSGPENLSKEALPETGDIHDYRGLDGREDIRNDMQLGCAAVSMAKARRGGTIVRGAPSGPEILTKEALPDGGYLQEGGNEETVRSSPERPLLTLHGKMTAPRGPDTPAGSEPVTKKQHQDWIHKLEGDNNRAQLTDEDTVSSVDTSDASLASAKMVCRKGRRCEGCDLPLCSSCGVEEHERGPALKLNPGPPFALGDVIIVDVLGHPPGRQLAFVMNAEHPRYRISLEKGGTL